MRPGPASSLASVALLALAALACAGTPGSESPLPAAPAPAPARLAVPPPPAGFEAAAALDAYQREARALVREAEAAAPLQGLTSRAGSLVERSKPLLGRIAQHYPPCGPYLARAFGLLDALDSIELDALERDYHADGALPEAPGFCYHAKDLLVHPATVIVLARAARERPDGGRTQMGAEMHEALSHLAAVRRLFELAE